MKRRDIGAAAIVPGMIVASPPKGRDWHARHSRASRAGRNATAVG